MLAAIGLFLAILSLGPVACAGALSTYCFLRVEFAWKRFPGLIECPTNAYTYEEFHALPEGPIRMQPTTTERSTTVEKMASHDFSFSEVF